MIKRIAILAGVFGAMAVGCAQQSAPRAEAIPASAKAEGPVIVRLVGQHQTVTVTSGPDGPLYTAEDGDGKLIVANASLRELRQDHPEVYQFIEPSFAADASIESTPSVTPKKTIKGGVSRDVIMMDSRR
jgi:hypothetical protein